MSTTQSEENEDFDFNDDDDRTGWDDDEIPGETDIAIKSAMDDIDDNERWECPMCKITLNVRLTMDEYNLKCFKCNESRYIPDETETISSTKWKTPSNFIWICEHCTYQNKDIHAQNCKMCNLPRIDLMIVYFQFIISG